MTRHSVATGFFSGATICERCYAVYLDRFLAVGEIDFVARDAERSQSLKHKILHCFLAFEFDDFLIVYHCPRANVAQDIGLAEHDVRDAVHTDSALERSHVHPIRLPAAAGRCTKLFADVADCIEHRPHRLKFLAADVGLVDLRDSPHAADCMCR